MNKTPSHLAEIIVERILRDLTGRRGLRQEWEGIDDEIREEIKLELEAIAQKAIEEAEA